ncbi:hypothetical protein ASF23_07065 [Curtobacterium sp. Leaf261]|nr:hypothetical protein ASF23_07065 [Curtobacterium sp. Leaf261]
MTVPFASTGTGRPVVVLPGIWPSTGVGSAVLVRDALAPLHAVAPQRRLVVLNRWPGLATGTTIRDVAAEYADTLDRVLGEPFDLVGTSTGGSIAQQFAADHPHLVRRLALVSTACRLGPHGRRVQADVAAALRAGRIRAAGGIATAGSAPAVFRSVLTGVGWVAAPLVIRGPQTAADLATTLEAEDGFDLGSVERVIAAPTLILGGERDRFYDAELFPATAALIPGSELHVLPRLGHGAVPRSHEARGLLTRFLLRD